MDITCPRCGQSVIEIRNWGPAGTLYIHSYTKEKVGTQETLAPNGCRLTAQEVENGPTWTHQSEGISR